MAPGWDPHIALTRLCPAERPELRTFAIRMASGGANRIACMRIPLTRSLEGIIIIIG